MFHGCFLLRSSYYSYTVATLYLARLSRYTNLQKLLSRYTSYTPVYPQFEHCYEEQKKLNSSTKKLEQMVEEMKHEKEQSVSSRKMPIPRDLSVSLIASNASLHIVLS